jgi:hypothetical protein
MKNVNSTVGKFYKITEPYLSYIYIFEGRSRSRHRDDDNEEVYWTEYKRIGGGVKNRGKYDAVDSTKNYLFYDNYGESSVGIMKPGTYKRVTREEWLLGLINVVFSNGFAGVEDEFFGGLEKI